jgi:hypothetical protein
VVQWLDFLAVNPEVFGFDCLRYEIFCVAVGLELGPLTFVTINEEILERKLAAPV